MADKQQLLGVCDHCLGPIEPGEWYTSKGRPRLYCSRDCRNTANSRAGAEIRSEKTLRRIAAGQWQNPADINKPDPANIAAGVSRARKAEVEAGAWRNPALNDEARRKLSRPRKHSGILHQAIEKLKQGAKMADLNPQEQDAYRRYRAKLRQERGQEIRANHRRRYHRQQAQMTPGEREIQRTKWRRTNHRRAKKR